MIHLSDMDILYHGSYAEIVNIDFSKCRPGLDFGRGFYVTSSLAQAVSYVPASVRKAIRRGQIQEDYRIDSGHITEFCYRNNSEIAIYCFEDADIEWLHFVSSNRGEDLFIESREKYELYDIIGGKVANDQTAITLNNYVSGTYGQPGTEQADRTAIALLETNRLTDQFCFKSQKAIASLEFVRSYTYGDIKKQSTNY